MKIALCGSLAFAKEIMDAEKKLQEHGHTTIVPLEAETFTTGRSNDWHHEPDFARQGMLGHYDNIAQSDGILVVNIEKNNIKGYIGWATLLEMGIACYLKKKIFILNPIPSAEEIRYVQEIKLMQPIILNGDLSLIQ